MRSKNRANPEQGIDGWGEWSAASAVVRGAKPPGPVSGLSIAPTGLDGQARVDFGASALNGARPSEVTYHYDIPGGVQGTVTSGGTIGGLPNGSSRSVSVWAVSTVNGKSAEGDKRADDVNAYGAFSVTVSRISENVGSVSFSYTVHPNGRPLSFVVNPEPGGNSNGSTNAVNDASNTVNVGTANSRELAS
ncbi:MAG: hypothetical protein V9F00_00705, partial [Nocardioides sp.]